MIKVSALLLALLSTHVASAPIFFVACSKNTCNKVNEHIPHHGHTAMLAGYTFIADSPDCPGVCSTVAYSGGEAHVWGHFLDVLCRVEGGNFCIWGEVLPKKDAHKILLKK